MTAVDGGFALPGTGVAAGLSPMYSMIIDCVDVGRYFGCRCDPLCVQEPPPIVTVNVTPTFGPSAPCCIAGRDFEPPPPEHAVTASANAVVIKPKDNALRIFTICLHDDDRSVHDSAQNGER